MKFYWACTVLLVAMGVFVGDWLGVVAVITIIVPLGLALQLSLTRP